MLTNKGGIPPTRRACNNCGMLGHLATTCTNRPKAHLKVGIEIEGNWTDLAAAKTRAENWHMGSCSDGSVDPEDNMDPYEFQTRPGSLGEALSQLIALYPDGTNSTCGMHVHVSFSPSDTTLLASQAFFDYFRGRWEAWGHACNIKGEFWKRLKGENSFCKVPKASMFGRDAQSMDRYYQLNFSAYGEHRTVECRLLPMFRDLKVAISAVEQLISIYEDYLVGGYAQAELSRMTKIVIVNPVAPPPIDRVVELDLTVWAPLREIQCEGELYPEPSDGCVYVPEITLTASRQINRYRTGQDQRMEAATIRNLAGAL